MIRNQNLDAYVRGGLSLKQTNTDDAEGILAPLANLVPRLADYATLGFNASWLRAGGGVRLTSGSLVVGASGGIDFPFSEANDELDQSGVLHLSGSIGVAQPTFGFAAGVTMAQLLGDSGGDNSTITVQAVGDVPVGGRTRIYGALGFAPEDGFDAFSVGVGVRAGM